MKIQINNWVELYENSESRKYKNLKWIPVPNQHDGSGFRRIASDENCCEIFTAWVLLLQLASKPKNGVRGEIDMTFDDMSFKTGFPSYIFARAVNFLSDPKIDWISVNLNEIDQSAEIFGEIRKPPKKTPLNRIEQNRIEKKKDILYRVDIDFRFIQIIDFLNIHTKSNYKNNSKQTINLIKSRFDDGFTVDDFKKVILLKSDEWESDEKMKKFLRPETLFGNKFESYLNQKPTDNGNKILTMNDFGGNNGF